MRINAIDSKIYSLKHDTIKIGIVDKDKPSLIMIPARGPQTMFHHYHSMAFLCLQRIGRLRLAAAAAAQSHIIFGFAIQIMQSKSCFGATTFSTGASRESPVDNACFSGILPFSGLSALA